MNNRPTQNPNLLTCAHPPPLNVYLDYLTSSYAARTIFPPPNHAIHQLPKTIDSEINLPDLLKNLKTLEIHPQIRF
jgi:hypothetical protein